MTVLNLNGSPEFDVPKSSQIYPNIASTYQENLSLRQHLPITYLNCYDLSSLY